KTKQPDAALPRDVAADTALAADEPDPSEAAEADSASACPGHGRNGADAYRGAARIEVPHASLTTGDACPACGQGTVYEKTPGVLVRLLGQPPLTARTYTLT